MIAGRIPFLAQLVVLLVLVVGLYCGTCNARGNHHHHCKPSFCGNILNIRYPFRLESDPQNCGDLRYNLFCEKNLTVLYLYCGKYYVQSINYKNYTIRVVDSNVRKGNCSSKYNFRYNCYSLAKYNFRYWDPYSISQTKKFHNRTFEFFQLSKPIIFMTCETPVNSPLYVDTATCISSSALYNSSGRSYVVIGNLNASDLRDSCSIELMTMIASRPCTKDMNPSYIDIHNELVYGFELSWLHSYERNPRWSTCYLDNDTYNVHCGNGGIMDKIYVGYIIHYGTFFYFLFCTYQLQLNS